MQESVELYVRPGLLYIDVRIHETLFPEAACGKQGCPARWFYFNNLFVHSVVLISMGTDVGAKPALDFLLSTGTHVAAEADSSTARAKFAINGLQCCGKNLLEEGLCEPHICKHGWWHLR